MRSSEFNVNVANVGIESSEATAVRAHNFLYCSCKKKQNFEQISTKTFNKIPCVKIVYILVNIS